MSEAAQQSVESSRARSLANLRPGIGRVGPNKYTASIKQMVEKALHKVGGVDYLAEQARANPVAFLGLVGKVLPMQLQSTDADGNPLHLHLIAARVVSDELHVSIQTTNVDTANTSVSTPPTIDGNLLDAPLPSE